MYCEKQDKFKQELDNLRTEIKDNKSAEFKVLEKPPASEFQREKIFKNFPEAKIHPVKHLC